MRRLRVFGWLALAVVVTAWANLLWAGGPLAVSGPIFSSGAGQPLTWSTSSTSPIQYRTDGGMLGSMTNQQAITRVQAMFDVWQNVPTANISYTQAGGLLSTGAFTDGDVNTATEYNAVRGSCGNTQNPIIFDTDGSLFTALGFSNSTIGFAGPCTFNPQTGRITGGSAALNGRFQDGNSSNGELSQNRFDAAFIHEFGHFSGLDHSQINLNCLSGCPSADGEGVPTMFPLLLQESSASMWTLAEDDIAWISRLYPTSPHPNSDYGVIRGRVLFSDGMSQAQGVNVIARRVENGQPSRTFAVSVVSGYRFTDNPGQPHTANYLPCTSTGPQCPSGFLGNNTAGSTFGSRDPALLGFFEISVPPGDYFIEVEPVHFDFDGGSSVGPLDPPVRLPGGIPEFWDENESANDDPAARTPVTVSPGQTTPNIDIILNNTPPRFDLFEESDVSLLRPPALLGPRQEVRA